MLSLFCFFVFFFVRSFSSSAWLFNEERACARGESFPSVCCLDEKERKRRNRETEGTRACVAPPKTLICDCLLVPPRVE